MSWTVRRSNRSSRDSQRVKVTRYRPVPGAPASRGVSAPSDQTDESLLRPGSARRSVSAASARRRAASASGAANVIRPTTWAPVELDARRMTVTAHTWTGGHRWLRRGDGQRLIEQGGATRWRCAIHSPRDADRSCDRRPDCGGDRPNRRARGSGVRRGRRRHGRPRGCVPVRVLADGVPTHGWCSLIQGASQVL